MTISAPSGEFAARMIEDLWPQVDETASRDRGQVFSAAATKLTTVIDGGEREQHMMFNDHIWSGTAAGAADAALQDLAQELRDEHGKAVDAADWYRCAGGVVVGATRQIAPMTMGPFLLSASG